MARKVAERRGGHWTAWCLCTEAATWFRIASAESEAEGRRLLGEYHGTVVADGYKVYKNLARGSPGYRLAHCWAHVLRKFRDTAENDLRSAWMLERIGELYKREREILLTAGGDVIQHLALRQVAQATGAALPLSQANRATIGLSVRPRPGPRGELPSGGEPI